jgi:hypothetical protein
MPVVICPNGHRLQVGDRQIGQTIKCPSCQESFVASAEEESFAFSEPDKGARPSKGDGKPESKLAYISWLINSCVGKPLLFFGMVLAILGRGCDATGLRSASWTDAKYRQVRVAFDLEWEGKLLAAQQKVDKKNREINELFDPEKGAGDPKRAQELQKERAALDKELNKLRLDRTSAQSEKETSDWKPAREAAMSAANHHRMWGYWHELLFIFGTVVLMLGLLTVAFATDQPAERRVAYIMIAIITFSIYVVGAAWIESIITSSGSAPPPIMRDR